ncbi:hypothetical protein [Myroides profundi]|uniref:Uncharacterized protein n=1 Tax=Myroides profundi TaxID=480520 RepID=A0AAJ4W429_MYRPR|nr:hypothetical protein [Myroides profundi]AJH14557.1 hypothetical protein MPR_1375 [Myroides profundi]SEQ92609.1 hypothetical protein SAMN04488089_107131 [Myroides profundi]
MNKIVRFLKILIGFLVVIFIINFLYSLFMVGSHPYAEHYILNVSEDKTINEIQNLKQREFSLQVPLDSSSFGGLIDEKNGNMYYVYFLLRDRKTVVLCYVKRIDNCTTTLGLISVGEGSRFLNNRTINARSYFLLRDLSRNENKQFKKDLEEQVLDKLNVKWKKNRWWYSIFPRFKTKFPH